MTALRLGTRRSKLALAQAQLVADAVLASTGRAVELVEVNTVGDESTEALTQLGGTGVFVSALRERVIAGDVDFAVHSLKDLPTADPEGLILAAVPTRADARDALVARDGLTLGELPAGSTVGTGSPRRTAQLRALGMDLDVVPIRGNVDTRLRKVADGALDAVVLARAGLLRLGRQDAITETLDPLQVLPAAGQGALAVECADPSLAALLAALDDPTTRAAVTAERALLAALEAGCTAPVGALAEVAEGDTGPEIYLRGVVVAIDGSDAVRLSATGPASDPEKVGRALAAELFESGAGDLLGERS
ncbi:MAG: hydroxymethylbilane synthase [Frankiales bacterium]|nr:hydroxymethylbilane synthase [Frankiales bacterium]